MDLATIFTFATLTEFAIGAAIGAVAYGAFYLYRNRDQIEHRWQRAKRIKQGDLTVYSEPEAYEGFSTNPVPDEERARWPWHMLGAALTTGLGWLALTNNSDVILFALAIAAAIPNIISALTPRKRVELIEGGAAPAKEKRLSDRAGLIGGSLFAVLVAALFVFDDQIMGQFHIEPGEFFQGLITLFAIATLGYAGWRVRIGPPDDLDPFDEDEYQRETFIAGITGSIILAVAVLIWLA